MTASTIRVNDVDLAYVTQGDGVPVIFVHGGLGDYRNWDAQMGPFAERYRAVAYSRRYHWPNARPGEGVHYRAAQHAADLGALIEALGLAPAHVVGSSYGALTALILATARPELFRSLVLGEPPLLLWLARLPGGQPLFDAFMANAFGPAREAFARGEAEAGVRRFFDGALGPGVFDRFPAPARQQRLDNAAEMRVETATPSEEYFSALSPEDVARLQTPTLLLEGALSPTMFGLMTDELARVLPHAERATIPAASHGMHGQNPPAYNAAVLAFLAEH